MELCARGSAVTKAVSVAEIAKRRLRGVHQITRIGLERHVEGGRAEPTISITLALAGCDEAAAGYQPPLTEEFNDGVGIELLRKHGESFMDAG